MFILLPIRTESVIRRTPMVNYALIGANALLYLFLEPRLMGKAIGAFKQQYLYFQSHEPAVHQFLTYQFLHADALHLIGNMLFLWVFGNSVNSKMGNGPYLLFYLAGGVFAAWGYALFTPDFSYLLGASGSVAAVTTAYLALFPRSHVTVLLWLFLFIHFIEVPAMLLIGLKVIVWDNIIAPSLSQTGPIAHGAHLAGYTFGFAGALFMLALRACPRDQFDILAVWKRWHRRRTWEAAMADPRVAAQAQYGSVAKLTAADAKTRAEEEARFDNISNFRNKITEACDRRDIPAAAALYEQLLEIGPGQCMTERQQLEIARELYASERFKSAAQAFERLLACYPSSPEAGNVRLLVGIIFARDLGEFEAADRYLTESMRGLRDDARREQCVEWLANVRAALGRPAPEGS
jgi:membrane associated rhomboid family serine protease